MARLPIQKFILIVGGLAAGMLKSQLGCAALLPPALPSHWPRGKIPPTPSALSAASSKRKAVKLSGERLAGLCRLWIIRSAAPPSDRRASPAGPECRTPRSHKYQQKRDACEG